MKGRLRARALLLVAAAVMLGAGCGTGEAGGERIELPTSDVPEGTGMAAELDGALAGDADTGCVWLEPVPEHAAGISGPVSVVWPQGFSARTGPLRLYRASGELVSTEGDVLRTGGGFVAESAADVVDQVADCRLGSHVWVVSEVE